MKIGLVAHGEYLGNDGPLGGLGIIEPLVVTLVEQAGNINRRQTVIVGVVAGRRKQHANFVLFGIVGEHRLARFVGSQLRRRKLDLPVFKLHNQDGMTFSALDPFPVAAKRYQWNVHQDAFRAGTPAGTALFR